MLKGVEKAAAKALGRLLRDLGQRVRWEPGGDPPDLVFHVSDRELWAVEVTELHQYFDYGGLERPRVAAERPLIEICRQVQDRVAELKNRDYVITAYGSLEKVDRLRLAAEAEAYIRSGETAERILYEDGSIRISALQRPVRVNFIVGLSPGAKVPGSDMPVIDLNASVGFAIDRILREKLPTLKTLTGYHRTILLIWSQNVQAEPAHVQRILRDRELKGVDCVLLVYDNQVHWVADPARLFSL